MSDLSGALPSAIAPRAGAITARAWARPELRRKLQLVLASIWLLDGMLQLQAFFFTRAFGHQMIPMTAAGNPSLIASPITWSGTLIAHHAVLADSFFAIFQVVIALGIAWRATTRVALAASIVWSLGVWWVGEGLGGVISGAANPVNGAPGAVMLYALLAVLLWPGDRAGRNPSFTAARMVGEPVAKALWFVLWASLAYFALLGENRSSQGLSSLIGAEAAGEPSWVASLDRHSASLVDHRGLAVMVVLAVLLALVAIGTFLPARAANATLVAAIVLGIAIWIVGENLGALFTNGATDVNSGPLLVLLSLAYWRRGADPAPEGA
jgi:hypothetical protein